MFLNKIKNYFYNKTNKFTEVKPHLYALVLFIFIFLTLPLYTNYSHIKIKETKTIFLDSPNSIPSIFNFGKLPLSFEPIENQQETEKFFSSGNGYHLIIAPTEVNLSVLNEQLKNKTLTPKAKLIGDILTVKFVGANNSAKSLALDKLAKKTNYFLGNDPKKWHTNISSYAKIRYQNIYPGIDLLYYGNLNNLEYDFIVSPKADFTQISLSFPNTNNVQIDSNGDLLLTTADKVIHQYKPTVYQEINGIRQEVASNYFWKEKDIIGVQIVDYNSNYPLVIDPILNYSTYLGGSLGETATSITVDKLGNTYVTGLTLSSDFPAIKAFQNNFAGNGDIFITKLNPAGNAVIYSTFIGGSGFDNPDKILVDNNGNVYLTGTTSSNNYPLATAFQDTLHGFADAFITKLNSDGTALIYSTYLGGSDNDQGNGLAVDINGNAYILGTTSSKNFPTLNPFQSNNKGQQELFISKLNSNGNQLVYSTYLGSNSVELAGGIVVDPSGNAYVTGRTTGDDFPVANGFQMIFGGGNDDAFVSKLSSDGSQLVYSTFLGGSGSELASDIAIDSLNNIYVIGQTTSTNFPIFKALQTTNNGGEDVFITKLDLTGKKVLYSTYLGGSGNDDGFAITVDSFNTVHIAGLTSSTNFPTINAIPNTKRGGLQDGFVARLVSDGSALLYSSFLGGSTDNNNTSEFCSSIATDSEGNAYVAGITGSSDFPLVNAIQNTLNGLSDAFVSKIDGRDFLLSANPNQQTVPVDSSTAFIVNIQALGKFTNPVTLSASVSPINTNITTRFSTNPAIAGSSTNLIVTVGANTPASTFNITITGSDGLTTHSLSATSLVVTPSFKINLIGSDNRPFRSIKAGQSTNLSVTLTSLAGFDDSISLSAKVLPSDTKATVSFSTPNPVQIGQQLFLNINTAPNISAGQFQVLVTGMTQDLIRNSAANIDVMDFSLQLPSNLTVARGQSGQIVVLINRLNNFKETLSVTPSNTSSFKVKLNPSSITTNANMATFSFKVKKNAPTGTQQITFTAQDSSGFTRVANLSFTIN